ncbi:MAG: M14 family zinc carboxypeptidase, partial [Limisphaerales bacterium]
MKTASRITPQTKVNGARCRSRFAVPPALMTWAAPMLAGSLLAALPPTELPGLNYTNEFFPGADLNPALPSARELIGFEPGDRAATAEEIERCLKAWTAAAPDRTRLVEYAHSHEGRPLHYVMVTGPTNLARLDAIEAGLARLGDPRQTTPAEAEALIANLPAVAWLGYTIHGDETEGSDAALALLHYLVAARNPEVRTLLDRLVVIIDPLMNPDGRERFLKMIAENRGKMPSVDDQSLVHTGYWPRGRGNHYLFDLNRDWILGVHPETRGRLREVARWNPQLFVDAHGMGAQDTHLFSPPRAPLNPHLPEGRVRWNRQFSGDQAKAFDLEGLVYYSGEWNEEWYPGYSDAWAAFRGAVGILYEQARVAENGVRRPEGRILSYRESVRHHVIGNLANLRSLEAHGRELLRHLYDSRAAALADDGPYARRTFAVLPTANRSRLQDFRALLALEGIEAFQATGDVKVGSAIDQLGLERQDVTLPAGTLLIPNRQPLGNLVAAMFEFDTRLPDHVLRDERKELLEKGRSRIYDATAWNLTMLYGLDALTLPTDLPDGVRPVSTPEETAIGLAGAEAGAVGWVMDGADDRSVAAAARLMERGIQVRAAEKEFEFAGARSARGSVVVTRLDNRTFVGDLARVVGEVAKELELTARAISTGMGPGDLPDLGGEHFKRLERPRLAVLARGGVSSTDYGAVWYILDHRLGIRHTHLNEDATGDLARYNVLVMPDRWGDSAKDASLTKLKDWVKAGGTLVAFEAAALPLLAAKEEFSKVRELPAVLDKLPEYELAVLREWIGQRGLMPSVEAVWDQQLTGSISYPWQAADGAHPEEKELKRRDAWQKLFMPQGAFLAGRVSTNHWLTFGCGEVLPLMAAGQSVLMSAEGVETPVRYGHFVVTNEAKIGEMVRPRSPKKTDAEPDGGTS